MKLLKELYLEWQPYPPSAERRPAPGFVIYHPSGSREAPESIKNISSSGVYLYTDERWLPGAVIPLTLQRSGPFEENPEHRVTLKARVIRWGEDGVGLAFALPEDLNFNLWRNAMQGAEDPANPHDILGPFRMAEALTFLGRICPFAAQEMRQLVLTGLGNTRGANAVEVVLEAELFLASEPCADLMRANPSAIRRIIEDASWADEDWIKHLWAGLFTTYCAIGTAVEPDLDLVERFSQLAPVHVTLWKTACMRAAKVISEAGAVSAQPLSFTIQAIQWITGIQSPAKIERDIHHLSMLGLIEPADRSRSLLPAQEAGITPSALGLILYARCFGHRGQVAEFYRRMDAAESTCRPAHLPQ